MATLIPSSPEVIRDFQQHHGEPFNDYFKRSEAAFKLLQEKSNALPPGELKGALLRWQRADGYAYYRVVSVKPLKVEHIPFLDGYTVEDSLIRGLRVADVEALVEQDRRWAALARKK